MNNNNKPTETLYQKNQRLKKELNQKMPGKMGTGFRFSLKREAKPKKATILLYVIDGLSMKAKTPVYGTFDPEKKVVMIQPIDKSIPEVTLPFGQILRVHEGALDVIKKQRLNRLFCLDYDTGYMIETYMFEHTGSTASHRMIRELKEVLAKEKENRG